MVHNMDNPLMCIDYCDAADDCYATAIGVLNTTRYCIQYTEEVDMADGDTSLQCYKKCVGSG